MNWAGGALLHHSCGRRKDDAASRQKRYFARVRSIADGTGRRSPVPISLLHGKHRIGGNGPSAQPLHQDHLDNCHSRSPKSPPSLGAIGRSTERNRNSSKNLTPPRGKNDLALICGDIGNSQRKRREESSAETPEAPDDVRFTEIKQKSLPEGHQVGTNLQKPP